MKVSIDSHSIAGRKACNQDFIGSRIPEPALLATKGVTLALADGISSSPNSHIASQVAVNQFLEDYYCTSETWTVKTAVQRVVDATNSWLFAQTLHSDGRYDRDRGFVCTFNAVILKQQTAHIFHIGDSRTYRFNSYGLEQLTHDHRVWSTESESQLSRALGAAQTAPLDYQSVSFSQGDIFMLTTDGVYEFLPPQELIEVLRRHLPDLTAAAIAVVDAAFAKGSGDNLSIQLVRVDQVAESVGSELKQQSQQLPPPPLQPRMQFEGCRVVRQIHGSARSHVFLVEDEASGQLAALKCLATDMANDSESRERFLLEEWVARRINNPHVAKAYGAPRQRNYLYTLFEVIEGQTLAQWARDNPQPSIEKVRGIIEQVAAGLNAFHNLEMLHQDIRPENILLDHNGTVKILDFGAVYIGGLEEHNPVTPLTYLRGTALYSAPEYFLGEPGSARSDQYALGTLTYFLLTGSYPYGTEVPKAKTRDKQRRLRYRSVLDDKREIPAWVDYAIKKAVQPFPDRRYAAISEFVFELRHPSVEFLARQRPPLIERNPVAVWQGIVAILIGVIVYLLAN